MTSVGEKITHKIDKIGKALGSARAGSLSRKKKSRRDSTDASLGLNGNELDSPEPLFSPSSPGLEQREQRRPSISGSLVDSPKMASRLAHKPSKSNSLGSINSDIYDSSPNMDQDDIIALTQDVRSFSDALARLKSIFTEDDPVENPRIVAHEHLGKVLCILKTILQQYPALHSTDILTAAGTLISRIKSFKYEDKAADPAQFYDAIDQVALAFSSSVSEYLMGDVEAAYPTHTTKTRSFDNLSSMNVELGSQEDVDGRDDGQLGPSELDAILLRLESGVELALQRAKAWSKYAKDIMTYVEKKSTLESEYARNLSKIAQTMRPVITEESFLPFQSAYCTAMEQDIEYANNYQATCTLIQTQKFIEPLNARRLEHDRVRKGIKEQWAKEIKKMQDAISNLRKARSQYIARQQEYEKAKEASQKAETDTLQTSGGLGGSAKVDKKKKVEEDAMIKAAEAETTYKACVVEANTRQQDLEKGKGEILTQIRELIYQCDQTMKAVTVGYFQLQHTLSAPAPVQYQTLCESCRQYEPGTRYAEFVKRLPNSSHARSTQDVFVFEPYTPERFFEQRKRSSQSSSEQTLPGEDGFSPGKYSDKSRTPQPLRAWGQQIQGSDTESASGGSSKSHDSSPSASPHDMRKKIGLSSSMDELAEDDKDIELENRLSSSLNITSFKGSALSKAAQTHSFRKLRSPSKCRECDSYVYFQGAECEKCGLASHKKCLEILSSPCGHRSVERRMTMFGVDFNDHLQETQSDIPCVVAKCILEIDKRGLDTKGIYRVSGVKSKVERLCQSFENGAETVDLSDQHTNVISNVLKLYLRQLPQPLITISLYPELIKLAKEETGSSGEPADKMVILRLRELVTCLPKANFKTLSVILHHLKRVSDEEELNQMSSSNLGIVFGPTLLRPSEGTASLNSLMDTPHQSRIIELLIDNVEDIFGASPPLTSETPIEKVRLGSQQEVKLGSPSTSSVGGARGNSTKQTRADVSSDSIEESFLQSKEGSQRKESLKHILLPGSTEIQSPRESVDENEKTESEEELATDPDFSFTTDLESDDELPDTLLPDSSAPSPTPPKVHSPLARIAGVSSSSKSTKAVSTSALQLAQTQTLPTKTPSMLSADSFDSPGVKTRSTSLQIGTKEASQEDKRRSLPSDVLSSRESSTGNPNRSSLFMDLGGPIDFGHHRNLSIQTGRMSPGQSGSVSSSTGGKQSATQGTGRSSPAGQGRQSPVTSGSSSKGSQALIPSQRSITDSSSKSPSKQSPSIKQPLLPTTVYTVPPNRGAATTVTTTSKPKSSPSSSTKFSPSSRSVFYAGDMVTEVPSRSTFYAQELVDIPVEPERGIERGTSAYSSGSSSNGSSSPGGAKAIKREPRYV